MEVIVALRARRRLPRPADKAHTLLEGGTRGAHEAALIPAGQALPQPGDGVAQRGKLPSPTPMMPISGDPPA
jgi:hypothetical protein